MTEQEEQVISALLDNSGLYEAVTMYFSLNDTGFEQGYLDGTSGKPARCHPPQVPELFTYTYSKGYEKGRKEWREERASRRTTRQIAQLMGSLGYRVVKEDSPHVVEPKGEKHLDDRTEKQGQENQQKPSWWSRYWPVIAAMIGTGIVVGGVGMVAVARERKNCMDIRRDMGMSND